MSANTLIIHKVLVLGTRRLTRKLIHPELGFLGFLRCPCIYQRTAVESSLRASSAAETRYIPAATSRSSLRSYCITLLAQSASSFNIPFLPLATSLLMNSGYEEELPEWVKLINRLLHSQGALTKEWKILVPNETPNNNSETFKSMKSNT